jgi:hypothetical protein
VCGLGGLALLVAAAVNAEERASVHGFVEIAAKNAYVTPRGLVVTTDGLTLQPLAGLVFVLSSSAGFLNSLSLVTGVWSDLHTAQHDEHVGAWNEFDFFAGVSAKLAERAELSLTYLLFTSPPHRFRPEHNLEVKLALADRASASFALRPYLKFFYAVAGDSVVVLGRKGDTFDVEFGVIPTHRLNASRSSSLELSLPTFLTVGGPGFFGGGGALGVLSTGPAVGVPLRFVPLRLGAWRANAGIAYYRLINSNLRVASRLLRNSGRRDEVVGHVGIVLSF